MRQYAKATLGQIRREYKSASYSGEPCAISGEFIEKTSAMPEDTKVRMVIDGESLTFEVQAPKANA